MVDVDEQANEIVALSFILPNAESVPGELEDYLSSVDVIEQRTGLDFFWAVRDDLEDDFEDDQHSQVWASSN